MSIEILLRSSGFGRLGKIHFEVYQVSQKFQLLIVKTLGVPELLLPNHFTKTKEHFR